MCPPVTSENQQMDGWPGAPPPPVALESADFCPLAGSESPFLSGGPPSDPFKVDGPFICPDGANRCLIYPYLSSTLAMAHHEKGKMQLGLTRSI